MISPTFYHIQAAGFPFYQFVQIMCERHNFISLESQRVLRFTGTSVGPLVQCFIMSFMHICQCHLIAIHCVQYGLQQKTNNSFFSQASDSVILNCPIANIGGRIGDINLSLQRQHYEACRLSQRNRCKVYAQHASSHLGARNRLGVK